MSLPGCSPNGANPGKLVRNLAPGLPRWGYTRGETYAAPPELNIFFDMDPQLALSGLRNGLYIYRSFGAPNRLICIWRCSFFAIISDGFFYSDVTDQQCVS